MDFDCVRTYDGGGVAEQSANGIYDVEDTKEQQRYRQGVRRLGRLDVLLFYAYRFFLYLRDKLFSRGVYPCHIAAVACVDKLDVSVAGEFNRSHLDRMNDNNAQQLEMMRQTVDEKLTATLNDRISNAFAVVSQSLESVNKGFGEMKELTGQVGNLKIRQRTLHIFKLSRRISL